MSGGAAAARGVLQRGVQARRSVCGGTCLPKLQGMQSCSQACT